MKTERAEQGLLGVLRALEPYADDIVLVGGWVPFLYARHLELAERIPLFTRDIDLAVPRRLGTRERGCGHDAQRGSAGCAQNLGKAIGAPDGPGIRMLIEQRPAAAFPALDDAQFGQYAWGALEGLRRALAG